MQESEIDRLLALLARLPGLGPRSAQRIALHLLKNKESLMQPLGRALLEAADAIKMCEQCGNIDDISPCHICADNKRDGSVICVVEEVADLWAFERSGIYNGTYHVLGGTLSAVDGRSPETLKIGKLVARTENLGVQEVIIATNATVEGQTTAHYIAERLKEAEVKTSRLAHGIPVGGELDYLDEGTLSAALTARQSI